MGEETPGEHQERKDPALPVPTSLRPGVQGLTLGDVLPQGNSRQTKVTAASV